MPIYRVEGFDIGLPLVLRFLVLSFIISFFLACFISFLFVAWRGLASFRHADTHTHTPNCF